jgi:hypothetical protein
MGAATSEDEVELTVVVDPEDEVDAFREIPGDEPDGKRRKAGKLDGGVGGVEVVGVTMGE